MKTTSLMNIQLNVCACIYLVMFRTTEFPADDAVMYVGIDVRYQAYSDPTDIFFTSMVANINLAATLGLGFIGGSAISLWSGSWQWGVRFTPFLGMVFFVFIIFVLEEPKRGQAEHAELERSTIWKDLKYLMSVKTYVFTTLGFTFVVFCVGAATWWMPQMMTYAYGIQHSLDNIPKGEVAHISVIFGVITCGAGIVGIIAGTSLAQAWKEGRWCLRVSHTAEPFVCAAGSLVATPLFFITLLVASCSLNFAWVLMFVAVASMCLNWALNMNILMRVIVPNRRASATAIQTLMGHLFGDASSPYIVGFISDAIRGDGSSSTAKYFSLQRAMFLPNIILVLSIACYLWSTLYIITDEHQAKIDMHVNVWDNNVESLTGNTHHEYDEINVYEC